jgi:uncharacterized membrane protein
MPQEEAIAGGDATADRSLYEHLRQTILTGIAIIVPIIITLYVLRAVLDLIVSALAPFIAVLRWLGIIRQVESVTLISVLIDLGVYSLIVDILTEIIAIAILLVIVLLVGSIGHNRYGERLVDIFDFVIAAIPGLGTIYKSFRRMGDVMLGQEGENFQEVKLVQCFGEEVYVIGFKTTDSPQSIERSADREEMVSMFLPLAPNPVTGGFLTYIPEKDLYDIEMTVDEAIRSILTSGVATGSETSDGQPLSLDDVMEVTGIDQRLSNDSDETSG